MYRTKKSDVAKREKFSFYKLIFEEFLEFCRNTNIHGFQFIAKTDISYLARFIWALIVIGAVVCAYCLMYYAWLYTYSNLTVTISDTIDNPIYNYIFPGVTICNINKISLRRAKIFAKQIKTPNMTVDETVNLIRHLAQLQYNNYDPAYDDAYDTLQELLDNRNINVEQALWSVRPPCSELLNRCIWKGRMWRCENLFEESRSSLGICCSLNYYGFENFSSSGFLVEKPKTKPRRVSACGSGSGLKILVRNKPEDYFVSEAPTIGVKVLLHDSFDLPGYAAQNAIVPAGYQYFIAVAPSITYATDSFKALKVEDRECIFKTERSMFIFANYSWVNCLTECRIVLMNQFCGCTPFFLRNVRGAKKFKWEPQAKACTLRDIKCVSRYKQCFFNAMPEIDLPFTLNKTDCYCLPECEQRTYALEVSRTLLSRRYSNNMRPFYLGVEEGGVKNHSVIHIYYQDLFSTRNKRDVSISWYSEMALFGGLLGLCFGFSFTSGFEIIYTFTMKIFLDTIHRKTKVAPKIKQKNTGNNISVISNNKLNVRNKQIKYNWF